MLFQRVKYALSTDATVIFKGLMIEAILKAKYQYFICIYIYFILYFILKKYIYTNSE